MYNIEQILEDMRKITMLTGEISSIHETNLKTWIFVAFDGVKNLEIKYDLSKDYFLKHNKGYVSFYLDIEEECLNQENIEKRGEALSGWIRDMLWNDIDVTIFFNNNNIYENNFKKTTDLQPRKPDGLE